MPDYNDIDLSNWKNHPELITSSMWHFPKSEADSYDTIKPFYGGFIPQVAEQLIKRYSKTGDIVVDPFVGSGTSIAVGLRNGRKVIANDIQADNIDTLSANYEQFIPEHLAMGKHDAAEIGYMRFVDDALDAWESNFADLFILHPPYRDIIKYSDNPMEMSQMSYDEYMIAFSNVVKASYGLLRPGRFCALIIGDYYRSRRTIPLGFLTMDIMLRIGFILKSINIKNIAGNETGKGKQGNLWRYRALAGGFSTFEHEYIFVFQKG